MQQLIEINYVEALKRAKYVLQNTFDDTFLQSAVNGLGKNVYFIYKLMNYLALEILKRNICAIHRLAEKI